MRRVRALSNDHTPLQRARNGAPFHFRTSRGTLSSVARALVAARLLLGAVEIAAALRALLQEQMLPAKDNRFGALDFHEDWGFHIETHSIRSPGGEMSESHIDVCGKCGAEIDRTRRVDFTTKDGTRVCDSCFVKETRRPKCDWPN
jgi:hypothetical protein